MSKPLKSKLIRKFREQLDRESLTEDVKVVYRVAGGMPHQRIEEEFRLSGTGATSVTMRNALSPLPDREASGKLEKAETRALLRQIGTSLDSLVPRSEARFIPDSVVGSITVEVAGEKEKYFFPVEEADPLAQERAMAPQMTEVRRRISQISQRLLESKKGPDNE